MVRKVFWFILAALIIALISVWLLGGGLSKIQSASGHFGNPFVSLGSYVMGGGFQLPWEVPLPQGPDISNITGGSTTQSQTSSQGQTFGNTSSYGNQLSITAEGATASDPEAEYVSIQNQSSSDIDISGWSVQSALSGARAYIPRGASFFVAGAVNEQTDIELAPGATAILTTGSSPVGTSFQENECSGYLEHLQNYTPAIVTQCPLPSVNASQVSQLGQACADFISSIPYCTFPTQFPSNISSACQTYAQNTFSYNGCVQAHQNDSGFALTAWRIYLGGSHELWSNSHDTVRLLDSKGQIVAVTSY